MATCNYKVVLSDKLYSIYKKAAYQCSLTAKERKAYELLIGNIELNILTNAAQLERCKTNHKLPDIVYNDLYPALLMSSQNALSLEDLSKNTLFKLILTQETDKNCSPYFNLKGNDICRNYTITLLHDEPRKYLKEYIKSLLSDANKILIYDLYFSEDESNKQLFELLPDKELLIHYVENHERKNEAFIHGACESAKWNIQKCDTTQDQFNRFARSHDRYLIIDDKIEITLTSGFMYIWNTNKEITCVIREI